MLAKHSWSLAKYLDSAQNGPDRGFERKRLITNPAQISTVPGHSLFLRLFGAVQFAGRSTQLGYIQHLHRTEQ